MHDNFCKLMKVVIHARAIFATQHFSLAKEFFMKIIKLAIFLFCLGVQSSYAVGGLSRAQKFIEFSNKNFMEFSHTTIKPRSFININKRIFSTSESRDFTKKPTEIWYGSLWPEGHFGRRVANEFANRVTRETKNNIVVKVTPPLPDAELTKDVIDGKIQMTSGHGIQDYAPELALTYLPYLYNSFEHFRKVWTLGKSPASNTIVDRIEQKLPVKILGYSLIGYRDIILRDGYIDSSEDFKNLRVRVDGSSSSIETFKAFGADSITIEYHKVKESLKKGDIDAAENTSFNLIYMKWYEECKNISLTEHLMLLNVELINAEFWNKLSPQYQKIIHFAMQDTVKKFSDIACIEREKAIAELGNKYKLSINKISSLTRSQLMDKVSPMKLSFVKQYDLEKEYKYILGLKEKDLLLLEK